MITLDEWLDALCEYTDPNFLLIFADWLEEQGDIAHKLMRHLHKEYEKIPYNEKLLYKTVMIEPSSTDIVSTKIPYSPSDPLETVWYWKFSLYESKYNVHIIPPFPTFWKTPLFAVCIDYSFTTGFSKTKKEAWISLMDSYKFYKKGEQENVYA